MMYKVRIPLVPMRVSPSHKAEMTNELLYGEKVDKLDQIKEWAEVACIDYAYKGWILADAITESNSIDKSNILYSETGKIEVEDGNMTVLRGSQIVEHLIEGDAHIKKGIFDPQMIASMAKQYLNAPYRWGGRSPFGIDCSGFTQMVFILCGYQLPRDASQQSEIGMNVSFIQEAHSGDLAFFGDDNETITHVGIILDHTQIIHASGRVRIDTIDHEGIYNDETKKYSHKLRLIKRIG